MICSFCAYYTWRDWYMIIFKTNNIVKFSRWIMNLSNRRHDHCHRHYVTHRKGSVWSQCSPNHYFGQTSCFHYSMYFRIFFPSQSPATSYHIQSLPSLVFFANISNIFHCHFTAFSILFLFITPSHCSSFFTFQKTTSLLRPYCIPWVSSFLLFYHVKTASLILQFLILWSNFQLFQSFLYLFLSSDVRQEFCTPVRCLGLQYVMASIELWLDDFFLETCEWKLAAVT